MVKNEALTNKNGPRTSTRHVTFKQDTEQREVQGYATIYGTHPSLIKSARTGMVQMQTPCNPYASQSEQIMRRRRSQKMRGADTGAHEHRMRQLMRANNELRSVRRSEREQKNVVAAVASSQQKKPANRTPPAKKPTGRQGAKQVKRLEQLSSTSYALSPEEATMYRALSARCNFLAQDRTDIGFRSKE